MLKTIIKDIHIVKDPEKPGAGSWSLARLTLSLSVFLYLTASVVAGVAVFLERPVSDWEVVFEALRWPIIVFAGYVWGGKFLASKNTRKLDGK